MYPRWPTIHAAVLTLLAIPLLAWSFVGDWFDASWEEGARWAAGVAAILLLLGAKAQLDEAHNRRRWMERQTRHR